MSTAEDKQARDRRRRRIEALDAAVRRLGWNTVLFHRTQAEKLGLSATDSRAMSYLSETGPIPAGKLAELTDVTTGAVTGMLDRLESAGLVRRESDPADRRKVLVVPVMGRDGARSAWRLFAPLAKQFRLLVRGYTDEELAVILDFVTRASDMLGEGTGMLGDGTSWMAKEKG